jgi:SAM-dependent methyltransferase
MNESANYWFQPRCAKAFWNQHELPAYQELFRDTVEWLDPQPGERWLDLGCGCGRLTAALWHKSRGQVLEILGVDGAEINAEAYAKLRASLQPTPGPDRVRFAVADFAHGFPEWTGGLFDGIVSGLALQYAATYNEGLASWTQTGYDRALSEASRLLKPGGRFVFSVNVPDPAWSRVAFPALAIALRQRRPLHYLKRCLRMFSYGRWLTRESRRGRFHYLPLDTISAKLARFGFGAVEHRLSYAEQAYLIRCRKSAAAQRSAA